MRFVSTCLLAVVVVLALGVAAAWAGDHLGIGPHHGVKIAGTGPDEFDFRSDGDIIEWWDDERDLYVGSDGSTIEFNGAGGGYQHTAAPSNPNQPGSAGAYHPI